MQERKSNSKGAKHSTSLAEKQFASHHDAVIQADQEFSNEYCKKVIANDGIDPEDYRFVVIFRMLRKISWELDRSKENNNLNRIQERLMMSTMEK